MPEAAGLRGIGVSPGRTAGPVARMAGPPALPPEPVRRGAGGREAAFQALDAVAADLERRAEGTRDESARDILTAQAMMAGDPMLREEIERLAGEGLDAAHAINAACERHKEALLAVGGYIAERAADLDDVGNRAVAVALGLPMPGVPAPGHPFVLVAQDLSPADTVLLDDSVLAIVTERGGPTSHTAILARGRGLPAVVACAEAASLGDGMIISVDGTTGEIATGLTEGEATLVRRRFDEERARVQATSGPGRTADGHPVPLLQNIGSAGEVTGAKGDIEGIGLFRTEFLFLGRAVAPAFEEQVTAYGEVFERCERVIVRTLDAGSDKPLPYLGLPDEANPALGIRGLRVDRVAPDVLDTQLDAIAEAGRRSRTDPWVMAPMVATREEAAGFAERARARGLGHVGVMIEVPAAALQAARLLEEVDFLSIGTNDLSQYAFAADREHPHLADLLDPWQPALLGLIAQCARAGQEAGKPVGVCGEIAGNPALAPILVGLGVTSLSMAAVSVPAVRDALAQVTLAGCVERAKDFV